MRRTLFLALCALGFACSDAAGPTDAIAGTYRLRTVNGTALPALFYQDSDARIDITLRTLVLRNDGSCTERIDANIVYTSGETVPGTSVENGTYVQNGANVQLIIPTGGPEPAFTYHATISGDTITHSINELEFVFER